MEICNSIVNANYINQIEAVKKLNIDKNIFAQADVGLQSHLQTSPLQALLGEKKQ